MFSFQRGLQTITDALAAERGDTLHLDTRLTAVRRDAAGYTLDLSSEDRSWQLEARTVLLTVPAYAYPRLEFDFDISTVRRALEQIYYPPVTMVFFGYRNHPGGHPLNGFGFLIPTVEQRRILGTLWSSTLFPGRAPDGGAALTTFVGGVRQPENALWDDAQLVDATRADLRDLLGIEPAPDEVVIERWQQAIPQYQLGHRQLIAALEQCETHNPGLYIGGNFRGGISVADCIEQSGKWAECIATELDPR